MMKTLMATVALAQFMATPDPTLDDRLMTLQSDWIEICLSAAPSPELQSACVSEASDAISVMRTKFSTLPHPHLDLLASHSVSQCARFLISRMRASRPANFTGQVEAFGALARCSVYVYDAMLEEAGGAEAFIKKMDEISTRREA